MIYDVHSEVTIYIGGWPNFINAVFHVNAKSLSEATEKAIKELEKPYIKYEKPRVEFIGREYEVTGNQEMRFLDGKYQKDAIKRVCVFPGTMTVWIYYERNGRKDSDAFGVWCRPSDFEADVKDLFSKLTFKEI
jgi:hypothetical protein